MPAAAEGAAPLGGLAEGDDLGARARLAAIFLDHREEFVDCALTPLRPASANELGADRVPGQPAPVRAIGRHRVVAVGDRDDRHLERELVPLEPARVAAAVVALVMRE